MRTHVLAAVAAVLLGAGPAWSQEFQLTSYSDIQTAYQAQNQEIAELRSRLASVEAATQPDAGHGGCDVGGCCNDYGDSCCNSCCDMGCDSCCCSSGCGWVGGAGLYLVKPHWDNNPAFRADFAPGNNIRNFDFDYDMEIAPLGWIGYVGCTGFGVRARWWEFDHSSFHVQGLDPLGAAPFIVAGGPGVPGGGRLGLGLLGGTQAHFQSNLNFDVWDLEATQSVNVGCWTMVGSAGVRYLHIVQKYNALVINGVAGSTEELVSSHNFDGWGPTISLEGRRAVGCSGLSLYGNARGSVLFGESLYDGVYRNLTALGGGPFATQTLISSWAPVSIAELELGADYSMNMGCSTFFARAGLVGQLWQGVGNASLSSPAFNGEVDRSNMGLFGIRTEIGVNY
jgi:hypothetical protein